MSVVIGEPNKKASANGGGLSFHFMSPADVNGRRSLRIVLHHWSLLQAGAGRLSFDKKGR